MEGQGAFLHQPDSGRGAVPSDGQKIHIAAERPAGLIPAPGQEGDVVEFVAAGPVAAAHAAVQAQAAAAQRPLPSMMIATCCGIRLKSSSSVFSIFLYLHLLSWLLLFVLI